MCGSVLNEVSAFSKLGSGMLVSENINFGADIIILTQQLSEWPLKSCVAFVHEFTTFLTYCSFGTCSLLSTLCWLLSCHTKNYLLISLLVRIGATLFSLYIDSFRKALVMFLAFSAHEHKSRLLWWFIVVFLIGCRLHTVASKPSNFGNELLSNSLSYGTISTTDIYYSDDASSIYLTVVDYRWVVVIKRRVAGLNRRFSQKKH